MDNLVLVAVIIIILWLGVMGFYFYTSRQSRELEKEINELRAMLEDTE